MAAYSFKPYYCTDHRLGECRSAFQRYVTMDLSSLFGVIDFEKSPSLSVATRKTELFRNYSETNHTFLSSTGIITVKRVRFHLAVYVLASIRWPCELRPIQQCAPALNYWLQRPAFEGSETNSLGFSHGTVILFVLGLLFPTNNCSRKQKESLS